MSSIVFRCDGGPRVGAGHVARSLQLALAFRSAGDDVTMVGSYEGLARGLIEQAGVAMRRPETGAAAGIPPSSEGAVVDSYTLPSSAVEAAARSTAVAVISDGGATPAGTVAIDYHVDAVSGQLTGPRYAPVTPAMTAARRGRAFSRALVTVGGGQAGEALRERAMLALGALSIAVVAPGAEDGPVGLGGLLAAVDVAVSSAGVTAYELACAGVPTVLVPVADNQRRVARAFDAARLALTGEPLEERLRSLADRELRDRLARAGPAVVDGYGAARARDALRELWAGRPLPRVLTYRPAGPGDAERQRSWRNDPSTRRASWGSEAIAPDEHRRWFEAVVEDPDRTLLIAQEGDEPVGSVRFDRRGGESEVSLVIAPERRGAGVGTQAVREASELELAARPELRGVRAEVRAENAASLALFERAGFRPRSEGRAGGCTLVLDRVALASRRR